MQEKLEDIFPVPLSAEGHTAVVFSFPRKQVEFTVHSHRISVRYWEMLAPISEVKCFSAKPEETAHL